MYANLVVYSEIAMVLLHLFSTDFICSECGGDLQGTIIFAHDIKKSPIMIHKEAMVKLLVSEY